MNNFLIKIQKQTPLFQYDYPTPKKSVEVNLPKEGGRRRNGMNKREGKNKKIAVRFYVRAQIQGIIESYI